MTKLGIKLQEVIRKDKLEPRTYKIYDDVGFGWFRINKDTYELQIKKPRTYGSLRY